MGRPKAKRLKEMTDQSSVFSFSLKINKDFKLRIQGSEAKIYEGKFLGRPAILKERFEKKYRHPDLDRSLCMERMRAEIRAINKCHEIGIKCPAIYFTDLHSRRIVFQEITDSVTIKQYLKSVTDELGIEGIKSLTGLAKKIGAGIAKMHKNELVHGDLTTSNLLLKGGQVTEDNSNQKFDVYFIDFGLAKRDIVTEDKAVDLYVLQRAISSSHPNSEQFYAEILKEYLKVLGNQSKDVADKLEEVRQRGRKRTMVG